MIYNPMVVQNGGEPQWQELKLNGTQDVPMTRAPEPGVMCTFNLQFETAPTAILFRTAYTAGMAYSVIFFDYPVDGWNGHLSLISDYFGVQSVTLDGTTIEGTFYAYGVDGHFVNPAQFLPIYN